jgi:tetratricopeptide (TPR) repeat protein
MTARPRAVAAPAGCDKNSHEDLDFVSFLCINEIWMDTAEKWLDPESEGPRDGKASPLQLAGLLAKYGIMEELDAAQLAGLLEVERAQVQVLQRQLAPANLQRVTEERMDHPVDSQACAALAKRFEKLQLHFNNDALVQGLICLLADAGDERGMHRIACEVALRHLENGRVAEQAHWRRRAVELTSLDHAESSCHLLRLDAFDALYGNSAQQGLALLQRAIPLAEQHGDRLLQAKLNGDLGSALMMLGLNDQAISAFDLSVRLLRECGERRSEATALANIGILRHRNGRLAEARRMYEQSLAIALHLQDRRLEMNARQYLGKLLLDIGQTELARAEYEAVLAHAQSEGELMNQAVALEGIGNVERMAGRHDTARELYTECLVICTDGSMTGLAYQVRVHLALMQLLDRHASQALDSLRPILEQMDREEYPSEFAYARLAAGQAQIASGEYDLATDALREAAELFSELGEHIFEGVSLCQLAVAHRQADEEHASRDAQARADALFEALGRPASVDFGNSSKCLPSE